MVRIQEAILVEGRYDKNTLCQIVDTAIFEAEGFGIMKDREKMLFLRQVAEKQGLIVFTDSDGAGFMIRNRVKGQIPAKHLLHAYIPELPGKEKRKRKAGKEGLLGVEGMSPEVILDALRRSGAHFLDGADREPGSEITRQDLFTAGLMGGEGSSEKRDRIKRQLNLPSHLGSKGFLDALNLMLTKEEFGALLQKMEEG